jgi:two-component system, OmpR family, phosphate regulon response regulator PhoB
LEIVAAKILIVEDEPDLLRSLEYNFRQAGFGVIAASTGAQAVRLAQAQSPDIVLLDLMLPDIDGTEVCRQLRSGPRTRPIPIIMVTAKGDEVDRIVGFELGADDYVTKPYSIRELLLRVRAVLRRNERGPVGETLEIGMLVIDPEAHRVHVDGEEVTLTALEFRLLSALATAVGRVKTREALLNEVWGLHLNVETRTVDTHVKRLREKLGSAGALVQTVRGVGYRLVSSPGERE